MARCAACGASNPRISAGLGACGACLRRDDPRARSAVEEARRQARARHMLPPAPPGDGSVACTLCANGCRIPEGERGFCGLRTCRDGQLVHLAGTPERGLVDWYHDPLPTNCVASWVCPAGTGVGYPRHAHRMGPEHGHRNLAVFYQACTMDCAGCQNWHFRRVDAVRAPTRSAAQLARAVEPSTSCICNFGGDPSAQMAHALAAAREARRLHEGRILRICWETNGSMRMEDLDRALELALESGGCIKFDLKCHDDVLHRALTGVSNRATLRNLARAVERVRERPEVPLVVASTLLVPGYVDHQEVAQLARYLASLERTLPYALLAFHGACRLADLPVTTRQEATAALAAARDAGLQRVHVGNLHLLSQE